MNHSPHRLNYIGSKYQLLEWIESNILATTKWSSLQGKVIGDLFSGTGIVSYYFRTRGAITVANDVEPYAETITTALTLSVASSQNLELIQQLQREIEQGLQNSSRPGFITENYSPAGSAGRQFFTEQNAKKIDYLRHRIAVLRPTLTTQFDHDFLLASLLLAADRVANVPAVYGCYLKSFKKSALQHLTLHAPHTLTSPPSPESQTTREDSTSSDLLAVLPYCDLVYLDPPYNERQYSKNYFPLNMIAQDPSEPFPTLKGKTGIPSTCFLSPLCQKANVASAFERLVSGLHAEWIVISYNSESLLNKEQMTTLLSKYGHLTIIEQPYKRFKSFEYNEDKQICEYLYFLNKSFRPVNF